MDLASPNAPQGAAARFYALERRGVAATLHAAGVAAVACSHDSSNVFATVLEPGTVHRVAAAVSPGVESPLQKNGKGSSESAALAPGVTDAGLRTIKLPFWSSNGTLAVGRGDPGWAQGRMNGSV